MRLTSPAFKSNENIPEHFTCMGEDVSPELHIEDIPRGTHALVVTLIDPDSAFGAWVHWIMYDIVPAPVIGEGAVPGVEGVNTFGKMEYGGPCPAEGAHRYVFTVYALERMLGLPKGADLDSVKRSMEGHVLAAAELVGRYKKPPRPAPYEKIRI